MGNEFKLENPHMIFMGLKLLAGKKSTQGEYL